MSAEEYENFEVRGLLKFLEPRFGKTAHQLIAVAVTTEEKSK
jgi:hypothetical protein